MDFSSRLMPHTATELACGLVSPIALLAGLFTLGRNLFRRIGWELALLLIALILSMLPTAGVFRWSFRWLPLVHLALALCAAESLQLLAQSGIRFARSWIPAMITFGSLLATYIWIPPNCGVPKYNLAQELNQPDPLDPQRLYLSIYPEPESVYRVEKWPLPFGTTVRPGSTSMWAAVRFVNGYSPIRPAGIAREFNFAIHGEIRPEVGRRLLEQDAGTDGILNRLGVDGIIIANEVPEDPLPESEWAVVAQTDEGRVFHRRGGIIPSIRSVTAIDSRPNEQFAEAIITQIVDGRNELEANVRLSPGGRPALLSVARPFFSGYRAKLGSVALKVESYRGLIPTIEIPAGLNGRLTLAYRPWWLFWGAGLSLICAAIFTIGSMFALREKRGTKTQLSYRD
jgi:hypothetical protein